MQGTFIWRSNPWRRGPRLGKLSSACSSFQFFNLLQVRGAVATHPLYEVRDGDFLLHFWVKGGFGKAGRLQTSQQTQIVKTRQAVERDQFRRRRIQIVEIA